MDNNHNYYVYVYIDPRNFEEFYYGQGKDDRKASHLSDSDEDNEKVNRIKAIKKAGQEPIIKVIASCLTKEEALLIEKTLIWKLGRTLTNISSGHFSEKFRPHNTLHLDLKHFDYSNGIYLLNVGEGKHRSWFDCQKYGFMSSGQGKRYRKKMQEFRPGDIIAAYWSKKGFRGGYVGVGIVKTTAVSANEFRVDDKSLHALPLDQRNIFDNGDDPDKAEWVIEIKWIATVSAKDRKWRSKAGLFSTPSTKASLERQSATLKFLETQFGFKFDKLRT
ncbi:MAG: GIY-YIG nuclease family protein [Nitrospirota bacterium]